MIGRINRVFIDFALDQKLDSLPPDSRLVNPRLGAGALLDIGVYTLMWGLLLSKRNSVHSKLNLQRSPSNPLASPEDLSITASSVIRGCMDVSTVLVMTSSSNDCQTVMTSTLLTKASGRTFARIEGTKGCITIDGNAASKPDSLTIKFNDSGETVTHKFEKVGSELRCEADAVVLDIFLWKFGKQNHAFRRVVGSHETSGLCSRSCGPSLPAGLRKLNQFGGLRL
jgi:predicted dehydrogenase